MEPFKAETGIVVGPPEVSEGPHYSVSEGKRKPGLLQAFPNRVVNIHPSLLPAFPGLEAWKQALDYGVKVTGCTVHLVDEGTDTGPILVQRTVPVLPDDTAASLHARIQEQEHIAYPEALAMLARGIRLEGRRIQSV